MDWSELQVERLIGHGSFGCVYLARWQETPCAVKVLLNKGGEGGGPGLGPLLGALPACSSVHRLNRRT